ncbi:GTP:adenosylcobinamide-phosphate guanylyltransferase [Halorubrum aquaticum]|uniref:GTP:adenosylcobinamide-phosphate guanylyltransferase n=1 Tax=Halorubrum aquaticum TaxID=387340 RepID=A0A1I3B4P3_9EURY|nr:GTP:adenosylcobinamide-phosphate guanylyltransferase [Halorubrum aquaticum]
MRKADEPGSDADDDGTDAAAGLPAVLLCGGRGTRLDGDVEKPLVEVGGRPMVAHVLDALADAGVTRVVAVASPHAPDTRRALRSGTVADFGVGADLPRTVIDGSGEGYVADLDVGLSVVDGPAVTVAADLPLLRGRDVAAAIDEAVPGGDAGVSVADGATPASGDVPSATAVRSVTVCVPVAYKRDLGASVDTSLERAGTAVAPTGLNVVGDAPDRVVVRERDSLAVNVNRPGDLELARRLMNR